MQTGSVKLCYFSTYCPMCSTIHGTCLRLKLMTCFAFRCTLQSVGSFCCVHLTRLHTCICTGLIWNSWKKLQEWVPHIKIGKIFRINIWPQTRRLQGTAQQRVDPRSPDLSPLDFCLCGHKSLKADTHIAYRSHAAPMPLCRAAKGWECVFPIWFTQCGRVWFTLAMLRPCGSSQGHSTAVERRPCCAVALRRTAWSEHGMGKAWQVWIRHGRTV